jgi:hypothetical protein
MSLVTRAIGADHGNLDAVDKANRVGPDFAVVIPVVLALDRRPVEDARGVQNAVPWRRTLLRFLTGSQVKRTA